MIIIVQLFEDIDARICLNCRCCNIDVTGA